MEPEELSQEVSTGIPFMIPSADCISSPSSCSCPCLCRSCSHCPWPRQAMSPLGLPAKSTSRSEYNKHKRFARLDE